MLTLTPGLTHYKGVAGGILSPKIWSQVQRAALTPDGHAPSRFIYDDFDCFVAGEAVTSNAATYVSSSGAWTSYEDTGGTIAQIATDENGVVVLTTDADDNQENWLGRGSATSVCGLISDTAGDDKFMAYECKFKTSAVVGNLFVGLTEEGLAAADTITDAGAMADKDLIGFYALEGAPTTLKFGYKKAGQTIQDVATVKTIAADTYYNVGFIYDPAADPTQRIRVYVDNAEVVAARVTATNIAAATFPDGEELNLLFGHKNVTDITALSLDGFGFYQSR